MPTGWPFLAHDHGAVGVGRALAGVLLGRRAGDVDHFALHRHVRGKRRHGQRTPQTLRPPPSKSGYALGAPSGRQSTVALSAEPVKASGTILVATPAPIDALRTRRDPISSTSDGPIASALVVARSCSLRRRPCDAGPRRRPSIDDIINLKRVGCAGDLARRPAGRVTRSAKPTGTRTPTRPRSGSAMRPPASRGSSPTRASRACQPAWSPDGAWLGFVSDRDGKRQIYRIALAGGEAERLTSADEGVNSFAWSPVGQADRVHDARPGVGGDEGAREALGRHQDRGSGSALHPSARARPGDAKTTRPLTKGRFVVGSFDWSPDGTQIAFDHRATSDPADGGTADISVVDVATGARRASLVAQEGPDSNPRWSPDGTQHRVRHGDGASRSTSSQNSVIADGRAGRRQPCSALTDAFDEDPEPDRVDAGRHSLLGVAAHLVVSLHARSRRRKQITRHAVRDEWIGGGFSITPDGTHGGVHRHRAREFPDVYIAPVATMAAKKSQRHRRADRGVAEAHARGGPLEEPGRRRDRRRAAQAGRLPGRAGAIRCWS